MQQSTNDNGLGIITIPFHGQEIVSIIHNGDPYVAMKPICVNLGLDWAAQLRSIKRDSVLSETMAVMAMDTSRGEREMVCLPLEYLNGWLFGIDDSRVKLQLKEQLITYKKECHKTLYSYFYKGYALNIDELQLNQLAQRQLADEIRKLRQEEVSMYETVRQVFKFSGVDYYSQEEAHLRRLFALVQDKFHYAVTQKVAARLLLERADASKTNMGLQFTKGDKPTKADALIAKNYLTSDELRGLENICEQFLLFVESKAFRGHKMTVEEIVTKLNLLLMTNDYPVLYEYEEFIGSQGKEHAAKQYEVFKAMAKSLPKRR